MKISERKKVVEKDNLWEYRSLLYAPFWFGCIGAIAWYFSDGKISFVTEAQSVFEPILGIIGIAHGVIASMQIHKVYEQNQKIQLAILLKDKRLFDENAYLRISPVIKLLLAVFSLVFFSVFLLYPFPDTYTGLVVVWTTIFILYLLWSVASELDDPFHGVWRITPELAEKVFSANGNDIYDQREMD